MDDVLILGSGIAGSMLAAALARMGLSVCMIDAETHPRFAIGEATTPDTSFRLKLLALRWGVPEIAALSSFDRLREAVGPTSGMKRAFSFVYHREGQTQQPEESHQYPTMAPPMGPDCHLFRQDTDAWMMAVAARYGARVLQRCAPRQIQLTDQGVRVETSDGRTLSARFLVDAAGFRSPLAAQLGLRQGTRPLRTNSRTIFTHMVGVKPYDNLTHGPDAMGLRYPLAQTTLHHVFPGGWMWVIPFNNHPHHVNPLCSVGLTFNRDMHPETGLSGEAEFQAFLELYPSIRAHLGEAMAVRPWISTGRLQYATTSMVGDRWALTAHSAGFIDALYSTGLNLTASVTDQLITEISAACAEDRFGRERFEGVERRFYANLDVADRIVAASFRSFPSYRLWDATWRVWVIGLLIGGGANGNLYMQMLEGRTPSEVALNAGRGLLGSGMELGRAFLADSLAAFDGLERGEPEEEVIARMLGVVERSPCAPGFWRFHEPGRRATPAFTLMDMVRLHRWYHAHGPAELRDCIYDWRIPSALRYLWQQSRELDRRQPGMGRTFLWESMFVGRNRLPPDYALGGVPQILSEPV